MDIEGELCYFHWQLSTDLKRLVLLPISDLHYGSRFFHASLFENTISFVKDDPEVYVVLNGDLCESSIRSSKGDIYRQAGTPQDQRDWCIEKLSGIKDKILGCTRGNHEARIDKEVGIDICKDIANALDTAYNAEDLALKISFGDNNNYTANRPYSYYLYMRHGYGGARTIGAKASKAERMSKDVHADVIIESHDHQSFGFPVIYLIPDDRTYEVPGKRWKRGKYKAMRKLIVKSNAYLKWSDYARSGGFSPVDLLSPHIIFSGEGKPLVRVLI